MLRWEVSWLERYTCTAIVEAEDARSAINKARNLDVYETMFDSVDNDSWYVEGVDNEESEAHAILADPREIEMNRWDGESDPVPEV